MSYQRNNSIDVVDGAIFGAGAYVVGALVTLIATVAGGTAAAANAPVREATAGVGTIVNYGGVSGSLFAHLWVHELSVVTEFGLATHLLPYTFIVLGLLLAAGYVVATLSSSYQSNAGFKHGASIAIGYFPLAVLATVFAGVGVGEVELVAIDSLLTLVVTGIVYPVVFGGLGGLLSKGL